MKYSEVEVN